MCSFPAASTVSPNLFTPMKEVGSNSEAGVMFVKELNAPKARLKLLIALSAGLKGQELKDYIEDKT